ncbi:condensation domain-containing protein [Nocardia sp. XZ_19_369]|uniref:condensation domain-containing protein n=1 Tax=Nocardia sp. XZ_19_369 TaxID=2769487 RepID=UPI00188FB692|nr:condensation domain-containing protein [Nocardia sp. XZ_19_369]
MSTDPTGADCATDIAIIGIGLRFPDATTIEEFRANLLAGRDSVRPMPAARQAATGLDQDAAQLPMGSLDEIDRFDHAYFGLSRREATVMDPQQRIALTLAVAAISDAGYAVSTLSKHTTAVVLSAPAPEYQGLTTEPGPLGLLGNLPFGTPARIAHLLDLDGLCFAIDSGCNSSLVAVHQACREITSGAAEYALAGGFGLHVDGCAAGNAQSFAEIVSTGGRCRAFDAAADGTALGEGGAVLLLTTVGRAQAERAPIHAVIRGSAVRHNGRNAATISTPSAAGQARVIAAAWQAAGASIRDAGYLEAHGSGTRLGDAIELEGLAAVLGDAETPGTAASLPIGSVKTNIGHLDHAAGIAGLVKAVLSVSHAELYPSLHFDRPTGDVDLAAVGVEVLTAARPWPAGTPRLAGVSSFSLGGSNAHCVVSGPPVRQSRSATTDHAVRLVGVSARSEPALVELCATLASALSDDAPDLADVAFTLTRGRDHDAHRFAVPARTVPELAQSLARRADRPGPDAPARPAPAVVLLMSPDGLPAGVRAAALPDRLPASGHVAELLARQIAAHELLRAAGIEFAAILSAGSCRYAARYLLGADTAADPADLAVLDTSIDVARLRETARSLLASGPVVFVEPSPDGRLGALLRTEPDAQVLVAEPESSGLLDILAELYERGIDLDWSALGVRAGARIRLPGHPMQGVRCWVDRPRPPSGGHPTVLVPERVTAASADPVDWLRATLRELLDAESEIAADANYFELGGNSIIAGQLIDRIDRAFGFRPKMLDVYERPEIADLAELIGAGTATGSAAGTAHGRIAPVDVEPVLSFGQERMWFHAQFDAGTTLYNYPVVALLRGPIDVDAIRGTIVDLIDRHETLRYNFAERDGVAVLRIRADLGEFFRHVDVSAAPDPVAAARELVRTSACTPFDLAADPLLRVLVIELGPGEHVLQVTCHHAVTDGATPAILSKEVPELYAARLAGRPHRLEPLQARYRDYAWWQRRRLAGTELDHELRYWTDTLRGAPALRLPTDFPRPPRKTFVGDLHPFTIPLELLSELRALAKRESASLYIVLLTGLYLLLARYSGQRDIVVGTPTTGRTRPEFEGVIGYFNSTVALRADLTGEPTLPALLERVRAVVFGALEHQEIPFDRVVGALVADRDLSRTPLFDVAYVHQEVPPYYTGEALAVFDAEHSPGNAFGGLPAGTAKFDLTFVTYDQSGADASCCIEFSTELFTAATVARMGEVYLEILARMVGPQAPSIAEFLRGSGVPVSRSAVPLSVDRAANEIDWSSTEFVEQTIDAEVASALLAADGGLDPVLLSAWAALLAWYSGVDHLDIGLGETVIQLDLADIPTSRALIERTRHVIAGADSARTGCAVHYFGEQVPGGRPRPGVELGLSWRRSAATSVTLVLQFAAERQPRATALAMAADLARFVAALDDRPDDPVYDVAADVTAVPEEVSTW